MKFNENKDYSGDRYDTYKQDGPSGLIGLIMKIGIAKDEQGANVVLIIIGITAIVLTIGFFVFSGQSNIDIPSDTLIDPQRGYTPTNT